MLIIAFILSGIVAYLLGSLNFSIIIVKAVAHFDIREKGSRNAGSTNVLRTVGTKTAAVTLLLDFSKAIIAGGFTILFFYLLTKSQYQSDLTTYGLCVTSLLCVLGHMFPVFFKFKGGKGVATYAGSLMLLHPILVVISLVVFAIIVAVSKKASLGSMLSCLNYLVAYIVYTAIFKEFNVFFAIEFSLSALTALIVILKHRDNIRRLIKGKESSVIVKSKNRNTENAEIDINEIKTIDTLSDIQSDIQDNSDTNYSKNDDNNKSDGDNKRRDVSPSAALNSENDKATEE